MTDLDRLAVEGRIWRRGAIGEAGLTRMESVFDFADGPGLRLGLEAASPILDEIDELARQVLPGAKAVRIVGFNKSQTDNWSLGWHQDRVIAVEDRVETEGYRNWTRKHGIWHVEPPLSVIEQIIFVRVHLDPSTEESGVMQVALGSHAIGRVSDAEAWSEAARHTVEVCEAARGDVLLAKALIVHRSGPSRSARQRRAIRIDYSAFDLPPPLRWRR